MVSETVCLSIYETNFNLLCDEPRIPKNDGLATLGVFNKIFGHFMKRLKFSHWLQNVLLKSPGTEVRNAWVSRSFIQNKAVAIQSCMTVEGYLLLGWSDELKQKLTKKPVILDFGVKPRNTAYFPFTWGIKWFMPFHLRNLTLK